MKRYSPKYKLFLRCKQCFWEEKLKKIQKFKKGKWQNMKKGFMRMKIKFFNQDSSSHWLSSYTEKEDQRTTRLKKTYRFLLAAKQRLQYYMGGDRIQAYQLKKMAREAEKKGKVFSSSAPKFFLESLEKRWEIALYHLKLTRSLLQGRKLVLSRKVKDSDDTKLGANLSIEKSQIFQFDPLKTSDLFHQFLKYRLPIYYLKRSLKRRAFLFLKRQQSIQSVFLSQKKNNLRELKKKLQKLKFKRKQYLW